MALVPNSSGQGGANYQRPAKLTGTVLLGMPGDGDGSARDGGYPPGFERLRLGHYVGPGKTVRTAVNTRVYLRKQDVEFILLAHEEAFRAAGESNRYEGLDWVEAGEALMTDWFEGSAFGGTTTLSEDPSGAPGYAGWLGVHISVQYTFDNQEVTGGTVVSSSVSEEQLEELRRSLQKARMACGLTQRQLGSQCGINQARISQFESGAMTPSLEQLLRLAERLHRPIQYFLTGTKSPGGELADLTIELFDLGIRDLFVQGVRVPGAFRPAEEVVARVLAGDRPDPRLVEAIPAVLAWNEWKVPLLRAYGEVLDERIVRRIAWLADVTLTLHHLEPLPGGVRDLRSLESIRQIPLPETEDSLGFPAHDDSLLPVSRRWKITNATSLETFRARARELFSTRER